MEKISKKDMWFDNAKKLFNLQAKIKQLVKEEEELKEALKVLSNNLPLTYKGFCYNYSLRPGSVDYKSIPELLSVNLELYRKPEVQVWSLKVIKVN